MASKKINYPLNSKTLGSKNIPEVRNMIPQPTMKTMIASNMGSTNTLNHLAAKKKIPEGASKAVPHSKVSDSNNLKTMASKKLNNDIDPCVALKNLYLDEMPKTNAEIEAMATTNWQRLRLNARAKFAKLVYEYDRKYDEIDRVFEGRDRRTVLNGLKQMRGELKEVHESFLHEEDARIKACEDAINNIRKQLEEEEKRSKKSVMKRSMK